MTEEQIAAQVAQNIKAEEHIPAPEVKEEPQPSAFQSNIELNNPLMAMQLADYFDLARIDRYNEHTQAELRTVYEWAAKKAQSAEMEDVLLVLRSLENELGATFTTDKLQRLCKFIKLQKQAEVLRLQQEALYA